MKIKLSYKIILIIVAIIIAIVIVALSYFFPLREKTAPATTVTTSSSQVSSQTTTSTPDLKGNPPSNDNLEGIDTITPIDITIDKLPVINSEYSLFYYFEFTAFVANINAKEGSAEAKAIKNTVEKWFSDQGVDVSTIDIGYVYK